MKNTRHVILLTLVAICVLPRLGFSAQPARLSVPELLTIIKSNPDPEAKQAAILKLTDISESDERNYAVTEVLMDVVQGSVDPFVPKTAVIACMRFCKNGYKRVKTKIVVPFTLKLKDKNALPGVRAAIAEGFKENLESIELQDKEAFKVLKEIAGNKAEQSLHLRAKCIEAVGSFGASEGGLELLCGLLAEQDFYIKEAASRAISSLLDKDPATGKDVSLPATNKLIELMKDEKASADIRVLAIAVVSKIASAGNGSAKVALPDIIKLVANSQDERIVMAGIEGLGLIGTTEAVDPLIKTYSDFFNAQKPDNEKDVPVRRAVAKAMRSVLNAQNIKPNSDLGAVKKVAALLVKILDEDPVAGIKQSTVHSISYIYPKKFEAEHKEAIASLIFLLRNTRDEGLKTPIVDALEAITKLNFGLDWKRWADWATKAHQGIRLPKEGDAVAP